MNKYILRGIAEDLEAGEDIAIFIAPYNTVGNVLHQITEYTDEEYTQVRITERRIYHESGGKVTAYTDATQARGTRFTVMVVPHGTASTLPFYLHPGVELIEY